MKYGHLARLLRAHFGVGQIESGSTVDDGELQVTIRNVRRVMDRMVSSIHFVEGHLTANIGAAKHDHIRKWQGCRWVNRSDSLDSIFTTMHRPSCHWKTARHGRPKTLSSCVSSTSSDTYSLYAP